MISLTQKSSIRLFAALAFLLALSLGALAQPSGGPYGPVQQRYEVPRTGRVYFVSPEGKAEASGATLEQPTALEKAVGMAVTGDTVILRGGVYRTGGIKFNQGLTLQPYGDERPVLKGTEVATEWKAQPNGLWRTTWKKLFPAKPADWWNRDRFAKTTPLYLFNNDMVFLDGEPLSAVGGEHEVTEKTYFIDYEAGLVFIGTNPEGHVVEITAQDGALIRTIRDVNGRPNDKVGPVIRGITFTQYAYRALEIEGNEPGSYMDPSKFGKDVVGTVLDNLTISFCSRVAGYFRGDKLVIRNCLIADCGTEGLYVIDSADALLERNIVTRTNSAEKIQGYYASAVKIFNQSYRVVVRDNLVIDNPNANGVWYDVGNVDGVFVNNWVENTFDGFFFEISKGAICAGNVFVNCVHGIRSLNSCNVQAYQNTLYNSTIAVERNERSAVGDHFGWHPSAGPDVAARNGHVIVNNLVVADEFFAAPLVEFKQAAVLKDQLKEPQAKQIDGNVYVRRMGAKARPFLVWSPVQNESGSATFATLDEFQQAAAGFEAKGASYADYWGVLFPSPVLHRFELLAGFPGANAGVELPQTIRELLKLKPNQSPFPGAYAPR